MPVPSDMVASLITVQNRFTVFLAGVVLSLLAVFSLKYLSTSAYHNQVELEAETADQLEFASAAADARAPTGCWVLVNKVLMFFAGVTALAGTRQFVNL